MSDELLSLRLVVVSNSREHCDLFRQAAASTAVPIDVAAADGAAASSQGIAAGTDLIYLDNGLDAGEIKQILGHVRAARNRPFTVQLTDGQSRTTPFEADALAGKPTRLEEAKRLLDRSIRVRLPSRVLVVDDSSTMRSIVRKLVTGRGFPLEVSEASEGFAALKAVRENAIDLVFVDYNMPGFSGLETISEFKREKRRVSVVLMTSQPDHTLPERAREVGAAFLKKPFYAADIDAVLCSFYGLRALNAARG
jgi:DNA-binding response OmpR family regulator